MFGEQLRSDIELMPMRDRSVTFLFIGEQFGQAKGLVQKRLMVNAAMAGDGMLFAVWTGRWSTDVFELDLQKTHDVLAGTQKEYDARRVS